MRLTDEQLLDVLRDLPRGYLDRLPTSNSIIRDGITHISEPVSTATGPLRRVTVSVSRPSRTVHDVRLSTCDPDNREPMLADFSVKRVRCRSLDAFHVSIRDSIVVNIAFHHVDAVILNDFAALATRWHNGTVVVTPPLVESLDHLKQLFDQLAVTTGLLAVNLDPWEPRPLPLEAPHFWAFRAVKRCARLRIESMPPEAHVNGAQIVEWLNAPHETAAARRLHVNTHALAASAEEVIREIKSNFMKARECRPFTVKLFWIPTFHPWFNIHQYTGKTVNEATGEELHVTFGETFISLTRYSQ